MVDAQWWSQLSTRVTIINEAAPAGPGLGVCVQALQAPAAPGRWGRRGGGLTKTPPLAGVRRSSFNTKSIYLHTQRWENHPAASVWINSVESNGRSALVQREKLTCSGVGAGGESHPSAPKLAPWSQGAERVPDLGQHVASLSPKKWEPPVLFSPSPRGRRPGDGGWGCGEGGGSLPSPLWQRPARGLETWRWWAWVPLLSTLTLLDMSENFIIKEAKKKKRKIRSKRSYSWVRHTFRW